jgi:mannose-1-phosphate guanylyltransferase
MRRDVIENPPQTGRRAPIFGGGSPHHGSARCGSTPRRALFGKKSSSKSSSRRWGVILAGGEGTRLSRLTRFICGDDRPKQFCPLLGQCTLLEQTRQRAQRIIPREHTLVALTRSHSCFYEDDLAVRLGCNIVQPGNKGTAPPLLYSLLSIAQADPGALVAVLPCDHHYSDETAFDAALESAFDAARAWSDNVVLVGAQPDSPEPEFGWIELGSSAGQRPDGVLHRDLYHVGGFREKPSVQVAQELMNRGSVWNTFVMVGHVRAFLDMFESAVPELLDAFQDVQAWNGGETHIGESLYQRIVTVDFSRHVLSVEPRRLLALRAGPMGWNDLGHPDRVLAVLRQNGAQPWWLPQWQLSATSAVA